ncbi:MAG: Tad domain-containing protein [Candidatus Omnitrophica bacterium]|nr:Tad domain-containing protein [Candidatus Omnitrophota bacterium]
MNFFRKNQPLNQRSQIAVIITFVIAVIFLFIAVFINLAKVSQTKTTTSTAADKAALSLASQLGSMSHYYKDKVLKLSGSSCATPPCQACDTDWLSLATIIVAIVGVAVGIFIPPVALGAAVIMGAIAINSALLGGINTKFKEMTGYNASRESTLFQALRDTQSDDVELKSMGAGLFRDAETGKVYDLSTIPEMRNEKKVSRFAAWYYFLRLPLVGDEAMKRSLDIFLLEGIRRFVDVDEWDSNQWKINKLSYVIGPGNGSSNYDVTCSASCPDWVKTPAQGLLRMVRMDTSDNVYGGFLKDKLLSLLQRLECAYGLTFCSSLGICSSLTVSCGDVNNLIEDLREFLLRSKEVLNLPVSKRLEQLTQWFPLWYNFKYHCDHRWFKDSSGNCIDPNSDPNLNDDYKYDIYLRLTRDQIKIKSWIAELQTLNNNRIVPDIAKKHGECTWGRGASVSSTCYTQYGCSTSECGCHCCGSDCSDCCCNTCCYPSSRKSPCAWEGTYYTCDQNPPVCRSGDLYGAVPGWCGSRADHAGCHSNCGCDVQNFDTTTGGAKDFQGQLSWRPPMAGNSDGTDKPTEVDQAIRILGALNDDLARIKTSIGDLADSVAANLSNTDAKRNEIIYAWKDKPKADGSQQFSHFVKVKITGYPEKLPNITESTGWGWVGIIPAPQKCRTLNDYQGDFTISTWRYDQDQPTDIAGWKLKRRKTPSTAEFVPAQLEKIVADVQDNAKIDSTQSYVASILDYSIASCSQAHYGPEKSDIYITGTQCE